MASKPHKSLWLVCIHWVDAAATPPGWQEHSSDDDRVQILKTYGLLIPGGRSYYHHCSTYDPEEHRYSEKGKIPRSMVRRIERIRQEVYE